MTLDDRSLREHLDRRATAGLTNPDDLAESVIAGLPATPRVSWWQPLVRGSRSLGAAAAVVAVVVAIAVLPRTGPGPGASSLPTGTDTASTPPVAAYPADRPLTLDELNWYLGPGPHLRAGAVVVADVELSRRGLACDDRYCGDMEVNFPDRTITVYNWDNPDLPGPYALLVKPEGDLELVAAVRAASTGLAWTLPEYLAELPDINATDRLTSQAFVVEATAVRMGGSAFCPVSSPRATSPTTFDVGCGRAAWLAPDGTVIGSGSISAPDGSLRIQNDSELPWVEGVPSLAGHFLVRPLGVDDCFLCVPGATSEFLGMLTPVELPTPGATDGPVPTATPTATDPGEGPTFTDLTFSTNAVALTGFETADINVTATFEGDVIPYGQMDGSTTPLVCLQKVGATDPLDPHSSMIARTMLQVEGTNQWVASFRLTAGDSGQWEATCLIAFDEASRELNLDPAHTGMSPVLEIIGTHAPTQTMEFKPTPAEIGQPLEVFGMVTDADTGEPLEGVVVTIGIDHVCAEGGGGNTVTTGANGGYTYVIPVADGSAVCTWITDLPGIFPGVNAQDPIAVYGMLFAHPTDL